MEKNWTSERFKDEKLYHEMPYYGAEYAADGPDEILEAVERT